MALQCGLRKEIERSSGRSPRVKVRDCPERGEGNRGDERISELLCCEENGKFRIGQDGCRFAS